MGPPPMTGVCAAHTRGSSEAAPLEDQATGLGSAPVALASSARHLRHTEPPPRAFAISLAVEPPPRHST